MEQSMTLSTIARFLAGTGLPIAPATCPPAVFGWRQIRRVRQVFRQPFPSLLHPRRIPMTGFTYNVSRGLFLLLALGCWSSRAQCHGDCCALAARTGFADREGLSRARETYTANGRLPPGELRDVEQFLAEVRRASTGAVTVAVVDPAKLVERGGAANPDGRARGLCVSGCWRPWRSGSACSTGRAVSRGLGRAEGSECRFFLFFQGARPWLPKRSLAARRYDAARRGDARSIAGSSAC
jgi:hypothetical protein